MGLRNTFSTTITDVTRNNTVYVETLAGFPDPVANVITLVDDTHYILSKPINCELNQLKIPDGGSIQITTTNAVANSLQTELTGSTPFIFGTAARLEVKTLNILSNNSGGKCFEITGSPGTVIFNDGTVQRFDEVGTFNGVNFFSENIGWVLNEAGLTFTECLILNIAEQAFGGHTGDHYTINTSLTNGFFDRILATPGSGDSVFNIDSGLTTNGINITDGAFNTGSGGDWFDPAGLDQTDIRIRSLNNLNVLDSYYISEVSTTYTALITDDMIIADTSGGAFTVDLFTAVGNQGKTITIKKLSGAAPQLTIDGNGSETIDGGLTVNLTGSNGPSVTLVSDNANWIIE